jgi:hypothetical protein
MDAEAYADMLPWLVFLVMDRRSGLGVAWAGGGALVCSAGLVGWSYWRGRYSLLPRVALVLFSVCLVSGLASQEWNQQVSTPRALTVLVLGALAFGSLRFTPLTETYTVPLVASSLLEDRRFRKVNVEMTAALGVGSLAVAVANATTVLIHGPVSITLLDWVTPLMLAGGTVLWAARRWELFRLTVDSVPIGHHVDEAAIPANVATHRALGFPGSGSPPPRAVPPLKLANPAEESDTGSQDAVIRRLPVRGRNNP